MVNVFIFDPKTVSTNYQNYEWGLLNKKTIKGKMDALRGNTLEVGLLWACCCRAARWHGLHCLHFLAFTCYLCFSCFCFSFSSFPSPGCWWRVAWRHSRVQLLQANKQHSGHMSRYLAMQNIATVKSSQTRNRKTAQCATFDLGACGIQWQCDALKCRLANEWISCSIFTQYFLPPARTMMSSWTGINSLANHNRGKGGASMKTMSPCTSDCICHICIHSFIRK